jgi:uncharacterized protein YciI
MPKISIFIFILLFSFSVQAQEFSHVFVLLNSKPDKEKITDELAEELQSKHMASIKQLVQDGKMIVAGPFNGGGGIFILTTNSTNTAKEWLQNDPAIRANRWDVELYPIAFEVGGACLVEPPYDMITYKFARIEYINDIANYKMNTSAADVWQAVDDQDSIIMAGRFPQSDGGIIIYQGEEAQKFLEELSNDQIQITNKDLWVAMGSFCEK